MKEATEFADTTLQWSLWTLLEMLRSPAWVGMHGAGGAGNLLAWDKVLTSAVMRGAMAGRGRGAADGCGAASIGHGAATVELGGWSPDEAEAAAIRTAINAAARDSPFLQPSVLNAAEMVVCSVQAGADLSPAGREACSAAVAALVGPDVPQIITATKPDSYAMRDAVEVTVMVVTQPENAYMPKSRGGGGAGARAGAVASVPFPTIPTAAVTGGIKPGRMIAAATAAANGSPLPPDVLEIAENTAGPVPGEPAKKSVQKLTGDMLRRLGLSDPKQMVRQHQRGQQTIGGSGVGAPPTVADAAMSRAGRLAGTAAAAAAGTVPPPLPMPPPRVTTRVLPELTPMPMPDPADVAEKVPPPESRAVPGVEPFARLTRSIVSAPEPEVEAESEPETRFTFDAPEEVPEPGAVETFPFEEPVAVERKVPASTPVPARARAAETSAASAAVALRPGVSLSGRPLRSILVPLPPDICQVQVAVRILEMEEDSSGNVIGYKEVSDVPDDGDDYESDPTPAIIKRGGGIFGWREKEEEMVGRHMLRDPGCTR